jgi:hypothetical protein
MSVIFLWLLLWRLREQAYHRMALANRCGAPVDKTRGCGLSLGAHKIPSCHLNSSETPTFHGKQVLDSLN